MIKNSSENEQKLSLGNSKGKVIIFFKKFLEEIIIFLLICISLGKFNIWTFIYLIITFYLIATKRTMWKFYILFCFIYTAILIQSFLYLSNLREETSIRDFNDIFSVLKNKFHIPWYQEYLSEKMGFFYGLGVTESQVKLICLEFLQIIVIYFYLDLFSYSINQETLNKGEKSLQGQKFNFHTLNLNQSAIDYIQKITIQLPTHQAPTLAHIVRVATEIDRPQPRIAIAHHRTVDRINQTMTLAQRQVQTRVHARAPQQVVQHVKRHAVGVIGMICPTAYHDMSLMGRQLPDDGPVSRRRTEGRQRKALSHRGGTARSRTVHQRQHPAERHIAINKEHRVVRTIVAPGEALGVGRGVSTQLVGLSQYVMPQGMTLEDDVLKLVKNQFGRRVVVTLYLVTDHLHLTLYFVLRVGTVKDDVSQQVDSQSEVVTMNGGIKRGALLVSKSIQLAAHLLKRVDDLKRAAPLRSFEGDVLAEMSQSLFARLLVTRSRRYLVTAVHDRRCRSKMNDSQPVRQCRCMICHSVSKIV